MKTKSNRNLTVSKRLFIYLSFVDIMTATVTVIQTHLYLYFNLVSFIISTAIVHTLHFLGCFVFLTITILRYISLRYPLKRVSSRLIKWTMCIEIKVGIFNGVANFLMVTQGNLQVYASIYACVIFLAVVMILLIVNSSSFRYLNKSIKSLNNPMSDQHNTHNNVENHQSNVEPSSSQSFDPRLSDRNVKKKKNAIKTLYYITLSYITFTLPFLIFKSLYLHFETLENKHKTLLLYYLVLINGGNNAAIYVLRSKELRIFYKKKLMNCFRVKKVKSNYSITSRSSINRSVQESSF